MAAFDTASLVNRQDDQTTSSNANQFTWQNVFGMFLTLSLCLYSQPVGSLFYPPETDGVWKITSLLWRLNPLACFVEAVQILAVIVLRITTLWKNGFASVRIDRHLWRNELQLTAVALLLIRANKRGRDGKIIWKRLLVPRHLVAASSSRESQRPTIARDATEAAPTSVPAAPELQPELLREALGSNALSHHDIFVDSVAFASEVIILIKLVAVDLPWKVLLPALCSVIGWFAVQSLLILLHSREFDKIDMRTAVEELHRVERSLSSGLRVSLSAILPLSLFMYFGYVMANKFSSIPLWISVPSATFCGVMLVGVLVTAGVQKIFFVIQPICFCYIMALMLGFTMKPWTFLLRFGVWTSALSALYTVFLSAMDGRTMLDFGFWLLGVCFTVQLFVFLLIDYDPSGTSKPAWLDVLG